MRALPQVSVAQEIIAFNGGTDYVTPPLKLEPGFCRDSQNFEQAINGGYTRNGGYERMDGRPKPSDATYYILTVTLTGTVNVGDVLTDNATTSFGTVLLNATTYVVLTKLTGHFSAGNVKVGGVVVGTCSAQEVTDGASTASLRAQYKNLAAANYRSDIGAVPGSGNILGGFVYNDVNYAFRANAGATAVDLYKSSTGGWTKVSLGRQLSFKTGTGAINDGDIVTGFTSAATGVVKRVVLESGTWGGGTAAGRLIFATITGTFQNGENLQVGGVTKAVANGVDAAITLSTGGVFETIVTNFYGSTATKRVYGCDGVNNGWEFDGTTFVPIHTTMTSDAPTHVAAHQKYLFFAFGYSLQFSAVGNPYVWSPVISSAGEIAMGDTITALVPQPGNSSSAAMAVFTKENISILYGSSSSDFALKPFDQKIGAYAKSARLAGTSTITFDARGISNMVTTLAYGNFASATMSRRVQSWLTTERSGSSVVGATISRDRNQYRLFFADKKAMYVTMNDNQVLGMMPQLLAHTPTCTWDGFMADGTEVSYFGDSSGYVYQLDKGTSFDGSNIEAYLTLAYDMSKSPRRLKSYRRASFEVSGNGYAEFDFSYELGYTDPLIDQMTAVSVVAGLSPANWDSFTWDAFTWDGQTLLPAQVDMTGTAQNVSLKVHSNSNYFTPITISGAILEYTPRRQLR